MTQLAIERCDPRSRESDLRDLFTRNGQPEFGTVFERAYRPRVDEGLRSWVGLLDGRVVMHISVLPVPFRRGDRTLVAGVLGDLMVDEANRDFWAPLTLLRTMVADVQRDGSIDFLLTSSVADAEPVFKAGGFKPLAPFRRYVLPLYAPAVLASRVLSGSLLATVTAHPLDDATAGAAIRTLGASDMWRPAAADTYYSSRIPRSEYMDGSWIQVRNGHGAGWALVSRNGAAPEATIADAYWQGNGFPAVISGAASWARRQGIPRLVVMALDSDPLYRRCRRAGFIRRPPIGNLLFRTVGSAQTPPPEEIFLTAFPLSSW